MQTPSDLPQDDDFDGKKAVVNDSFRGMLCSEWPMIDALQIVKHGLSDVGH